VKGYTKWLDSQDDNDPQQNEVDRNAMLSTFVQFFETTLALEFKDPAVQRRILSSLVAMVVRVLRRSRPDLGIAILQRLLKLDIHDDPSLPEYSEAAKALSYLAVTESQKLAGIMPNSLFELYDDLESRIRHMMATQNLDEAHRLGYQAFLFIIVLKAKDLDEAIRVSKLRDMMHDSTSVWTSQEFTKSAADFGSFLSILGLGPLPEYLYSHNFHKIQDWGDHFLDAEGTAIQASVNDRMEVCISVISIGLC
jgi:exportin-5